MYVGALFAGRSSSNSIVVPLELFANTIASTAFLFAPTATALPIGNAAPLLATRVLASVMLATPLVVIGLVVLPPKHSAIRSNSGLALGVSESASYADVWDRKGQVMVSVPPCSEPGTTSPSTPA